MNHRHPDRRPSPYPAPRWFNRQRLRLKHYGERQDRLQMLARMAQRVHLPVAFLDRARHAAREVLHRARSGPLHQG